MVYVLSRTPLCFADVTCAAQPPLLVQITVLVAIDRRGAAVPRLRPSIELPISGSYSRTAVCRRN